MPEDRHGGDAFERLFRAEYARLVGVSERLTRDRALSEDVVQEVFIRYHERGTADRAALPAAYLRRAVVTRTLNALRDRKRIELPGDDAFPSAGVHADPQDSDHLADQKARLRKAVDALPPRARLILMLHRFEGYTYAEIARDLDIAPKTVENQLARALKLLRATLVACLATGVALNFSNV